jgi:hypothetical protein
MDVQGPNIGHRTIIIGQFIVCRGALSFPRFCFPIVKWLFWRRGSVIINN